jgi:hypothetical protein
MPLDDVVLAKRLVVSNTQASEAFEARFTVAHRAIRSWARSGLVDGHPRILPRMAVALTGVVPLAKLPESVRDRASRRSESATTMETHGAMMRNGVAKTDSKKPNGSPVRRVVTVRAVMHRLRRMLPSGQTLMKSRPIGNGKTKRYPNDVGQFFLVNDSTIVEHHVDLDAFARRHGALKPWEQVCDDDQEASENGASKVQKRA